MSSQRVVFFINSDKSSSVVGSGVFVSTGCFNGNDGNDSVLDGTEVESIVFLGCICYATFLRTSHSIFFRVDGITPIVTAIFYNVSLLRDFVFLWMYPVFVEKFVK